MIAEKEKAHEGNKSSKCIFLKTGKVFTLGFSKRCDRQYALWDPKSMDKALTHEEIDQAAGVLFPFYDAESDIIYVAGKGDTSIRYFEVNDDEPYVHYLNMYQSQNSQRGLGFMPKRGCDSNKNEIARFFKLSSNKCEPVSFTVPRKAETFQKDLYPPCISSTPALSAEEWFSGKDKNPIMMQMTAESGDGSTDRDFVKSNTRISTILSSSANTSRPISQVSTNGNGVLAAALPEGLNIEELLEDIKKLKATVRKQGRRIAKLEAQLEEKAA